MYSYRQQKRVVSLFIVFALVFSGIILRLAYWQLFMGEKMSREAWQRQSSSVSLEQVPRGLIMDRNGRPLTDPVNVSRVVIFPRLVQDKAALVRELAGIVGIKEPDLAGKIGVEPVVLPYNLSRGQAEEVRKRALAGVTVMPYFVRYGPGALATHLVGYVDEIYDNREWQSLRGLGPKKYSFGDLVGKEGLEKTFEADLKGVLPEKVGRAFLDGARRLMTGMGFTTEVSIDNGRANLVTTIDTKIQRIVETVMDTPAGAEAGAKEIGPKTLVPEGAVVVLDTKTAEILALASRPKYNQNSPVSSQEGAFLNHAMEMYPPGSVFKPVVAAAALEDRVVREDQLFFCPGENDTLVSCVKKEGHGFLTFAEALSESCNPTFARVGLLVGGDRLMDYAIKMGFNKEKMALLKERDNIVNGSIGQWPVEASPLQVAAMMNALATGGYWRQPQAVLSLETSDGKTLKEFPRGEGRRIVSGGTAEKLKNMLASAVNFGTGKKARVKAVQVAGKTGSSQVRKDGPTHAWFAGFASGPNPRYTVVVFIKEGGTGGDAAAPVFREIIEKLFE